MNKKYLKAAVGVLIVAGLGIGGWMRWQDGRDFVSTDNAQVSGTIIPIRARMAGILVEVPITDNQHIRQGQVLYQLRDDEYRLQLQQAQAAYQQLLIAAGQGDTPGVFDSQLRDARLRADAAQASTAQLQASLRQARVDYERASRLQANDVVTIQALEQAKARLDVATHQLEAARQQAGAAAQGPKLQAAQLKIEQQRITAAEATLTLGQLKLTDTRQTAPANGIVADRHAEPGQFVVAGQKLLSLVLTDHLWVDANLKETGLEHVKIGQSAQVKVDAFPDHLFKGVVQSLVPATGASFSLLPQENATASFTKVVQRIQVRIELVDVPAAFRDRLLQGMSADVRIDVRPAAERS